MIRSMANINWTDHNLSSPVCAQFKIHQPPVLLQRTQQRQQLAIMLRMERKMCAAVKSLESRYHRIDRVHSVLAFALVSGVIASGNAKKIEGEFSVLWDWVSSWAVGE